MTKVSREEYLAFIRTSKDIAYYDICGIVEPPVISHYDKDHNLLAQTHDYDSGYQDVPEEKRNYYIRKGEWVKIVDPYSGKTLLMKCSTCLRSLSIMPCERPFKYCPNCGSQNLVSAIELNRQLPNKG